MDYNTLGYRFSPTDEEIITYFLENEMRGNDFPVRVITQVDICKFEPWELPGMSTEPKSEEWYFFHKLKHSYGGLIERRTKEGHWKVTSNDITIWDDSRKQIGFKKILVFYKGHGSKKEKTSWVIHEYHSNNAPADQSPLVLCRLKENLDDKAAKSTRGGSSRRAASNF